LPSAGASRRLDAGGVASDGVIPVAHTAGIKPAARYTHLHIALMASSDPHRASFLLMRPLEIILLLANVPLLVGCLSARALPGWWRILPVAAFLVMVLHLWVEGARWHMAPGYLVTVGLLASCCGPRRRQPGRWSALAAIGLLLGAAAVGTLLPVFDLPKPTGPYPIGTVTWHLVDAARQETQSPQPGGPRELMIQVWYPAESAGPGQAYRTRAETDLKRAHLALVKTHAATGVPVARTEARYPVVLFSPAWMGRRNQNTVQAEELASHGFVVAGIDHPYDTELTFFPDGRTAWTTVGDFLDFRSDAALQASIQATEARLQIRVADVRFVLDELERRNQSDPEQLLTGRLDTSRVGIFGHSFGGAVAAEVCLLDPRFRAGIDFDGYFFGKSLTQPIDKPFMLVSNAFPDATMAGLKASNTPAYRELAFTAHNEACIRAALSGCRGYAVRIDGVLHMHFCDSAPYSPIRRWTHAGRIAPERAMEIINAYVLSFFQANLNNRQDALLDAPSSPYPEAAVERFPNK
jgi:predicted dienelactone hydrolase